MKSQGFYRNYLTVFGVSHTGEKLTTDHKFKAGLMDNNFAAAAIMRLEQFGRLDIRKPIVNYLPRFRMKDERYKDITIKHILTHTSGISDAPALEQQQLRSTPGTAYHYSDTAYRILKDVIEHITDVTFEHYVKVVMLENIVHTRKMDDSLRHEVSVEDLDAWADINMPGSIVPRHMAPETHAKMMSPAFLVDSVQHIAMALGWTIQKYKGIDVYQYEGSDANYQVLIMLLPGMDATISLICHRCPDISNTRNRLLDMILSQHKEDIP